MSVVAISGTQEFFLFENKLSFRSKYFYDEEYAYTTIEFTEGLRVLSTKEIEDDIFETVGDLKITYTDDITIARSNGVVQKIIDDSYQRGDSVCALTRLSNGSCIIVNEGDVCSCLVFCNGEVIVKHKKEKHEECENDSCVFCDTNPVPTTFEEINTKLIGVTPLANDVIYAL